MIKIVLSVLMMAATLVATVDSRAIVRDVVDVKGKKLTSYAGSYALVIGVSNYTNGWSDLESIPSELSLVKKTLKAKGFKIVPVEDPNSKELEDAYEDFIDKYGYDKQNRLLFFYSGHGHSTNNGSKGYLVPADAPNPNKDLKGFKRKALNMSRLIFLSNKIEANHSLFLFDSCFSGTIFKTKALLKIPKYIEKSISQPVRQFITAGSAGETVPAKSTFTPMFNDAINGEADLNRDGYVTGKELGYYLQTNVPNHTDQTPQFGKGKDYTLNRGDFIFFTPLLPKPIKPKPKLNVNAEDELWSMVKSSNTIEDYNYYITSYPNGKYIANANYKIKKLKKVKPVKQRVSTQVKPNKKPSSGNTWIDKDTNLEWQVKITKGLFDDGGGYNWAKNYCSNLSLDAKDNWRLPNKNELNSIVTKESYANSKTLFGTHIKEPLLKSMDMENQRFWSSTSNEKDSSQAWIVYFSIGINIGNGNYHNKSNQGYVRCVSDASWWRDENESITIDENKTKDTSGWWEDNKTQSNSKKSSWWD